MHIVYTFLMCFEFFISRFECIAEKRQQNTSMCKCNKKLQRKFYFMLPTPQMHVVILYTHTAHILTPTTLMVAENFIYVCRKTEKFSVCCCCCCCRYRSWCYSIQSHHHQMHFIFIIYACTETVSLYMHLECTLPMKCK